MVEAPQFAGLRLPAEADGVAQAGGKDGALLAVRRDAQDGRIFRVALIADVAGAAHAQVQHAVGAEGDGAVRMLAGIRQVADQQFQLAQAAVAEDVGDEQFLDRDEVQLVVADCQAVRAGAAGHGDRRAVGLAVAVGIAQQQHVALVAPAQVDVAVGRDGQDAGVFQAGGIGGDGEPGRGFQRRDARRGGLDLGWLEDGGGDGDVGAVSLLGGSGGGDAHQAGGDDTVHGRSCKNDN
jgi:hypothetical protein